MISKTIERLRRAKRTRMHIREMGATWLTVTKTPRHMRAQILTSGGDKVLAQASTLEKELRSKPTGNIVAAEAVGSLLAERAIKAGVDHVAFDRSGYPYHGRVKALAEAARKGGLKF